MENFGELCLLIFISVQLLDEHFYIYKLFSLELKAMYDLHDELDEFEEELIEEKIDTSHIWSLPSEIFPVSSQKPLLTVSAEETSKATENKIVVLEPISTDFKNTIIDQDTYAFFSNLDEAVEHNAILDEAVEHNAILGEAVEHNATLDEAVEHNAILDEAVEHNAILDEAVEHNAILDEAEGLSINKGGETMNDFLSIDAWSEEIPAFNLFKTHNQHIKDEIEGEQIWFCEIFGKNDSFIHVLDLEDKIWLDTSDLGCVKIHLHEVVKLKVYRTKKEVKLLELEYLDIEEPSDNPPTNIGFSEDYLDYSLEYGLEERD